MDVYLQIAEELNIKRNQVKTVLSLFEEGATVPFIARYRKEKTGGLDEEQLRTIEERFNYLNLLETRKNTVLKSIEEQGKLTDELKNKILSATKLREVEDLYLPFKPKRKTRGSVARSRGLQPLADFILNTPDFKGNFQAKLSEFVNSRKGINTTDEALQGALDIIAEMISLSAEARQITRETLFEKGVLISKKKKSANLENTGKRKNNYEIYFDFKIALSGIKPHQILAINRGEREGFLTVSFDFPKEYLINKIYATFFGAGASAFEKLLKNCAKDSFERLLYPSLEREIRNSLTEKADLHAIDVFAKNLRQLLLQPPIRGKKIMGIDPGFVSGSKVAVIDETGKYLEGVTVYPHPPQNNSRQAKKKILDLINKYSIEIIAIGNGTASRETVLLITELIKENNLACRYLVVSEAGASVYSASELAREEFPELDASMRGNISIARRVLDPLAELVKIDPKSIGVGLYQHDVNQKLLRKKLDDVVISCVNYVGVDLNTASAPLLSYVSGLNKRLANAIVKYRDENGAFLNRSQLTNVPGIGDKVFEQAAGFLKIPDGNNPLDNTFIHPESYVATEKLLKLSSVLPEEINTEGNKVKEFVNNNGLEKTAEMLGIGIPTLTDIIENLLKPGRDPREELPQPILRNDVLRIEDLKKGMLLKGTVRNIVDFGAFVDVGVKEDGLIHISQLGDKFIKHPLEILSVGDIVAVEILETDVERGRISLKLL